MKPASDLSSYETSQADRWEPIKSSIIGQEALLRKTLTSQRLATKTTYKSPHIINRRYIYTLSKKHLLLSDLYISFRKVPFCSNFGIEGVVASTTPVTIIEDTYTLTGSRFHLPISTDEFTFHQFGTICGKRHFQIHI